MYKILIPSDKKTAIRGYWIDDKRIYADNLLAIYRPTITKKQLDYICRHYKQKAIFYSVGATGYIYNENGTIDKLSHFKGYYFDHVKPSIVKSLIKKYGGLTIYRVKNGYNVKVYYND